MGFFERMINFYNFVYTHFKIKHKSAQLLVNVRAVYLSRYQLYQFQQPIFNRLIDVNFPSVQAITRSVSLIFVNSNEFFELPRPISNKLIYIGGINNAEPISPSAKVQQVILFYSSLFINTHMNMLARTKIIFSMPVTQ